MAGCLELNVYPSFKRRKTSEETQIRYCHSLLADFNAVFGGILYDKGMAYSYVQEVDREMVNK